ncbi:MAG TPA: thermonuclease family protein [Enterovirga sp.]
MWSLVAAALLPLVLSPALAQSRQSAPGCDVPEVVDRIEAVSEDGEIRLGRLGAVRIADIRLPEGNEAARPLAWLRSLAGRETRVSAGPPDRWQRRRAILLLKDDVPPIDVGELLVAEGYALVDPGEEDTLCRPNLLAVETRARERRLGLWKADGEPLLRALDIAAVAKQVGRFAIVEGRVVSVGERPARTYLNFGHVGRGALTVTLPKRTWSTLRARGVTAESLRGRRVRARGIVEMWRAATMEVVAPELIEILDGNPDLKR